MSKQSNSKPNKGKSKTSFSREKRYANSEIDIELNEARENTYAMKRGQERIANIKHYGGDKNVEEKLSKLEAKLNTHMEESISMTDLDVNNTNDKNKNNDHIDNLTLYIYPQLNLQFQNVPLTYNIDNLLREFKQYGEINYIKTTVVSDFCVATIVPICWNEESDEIVLLQHKLFNSASANGRVPWQNGIYITIDAEQSISEWGTKIIV